MLTRPMLNIQILFTNYDIIAYFLNLAFCSEHFISIINRILATFNINKKFNYDSLYAFNARNNQTLQRISCVKLNRSQLRVLHLV
jgi:hypothetical protein